MNKLLFLDASGMLWTIVCSSIDLNDFSAFWKDLQFLVFIWLSYISDMIVILSTVLHGVSDALKIQWDLTHALEALSRTWLLV